MTNPVIHFEIGGPDLGRMASFYGDLFGWQLQPAGPEYSLVPAGADGIGGGLLQTSGEMPPYVTVYVAVDDLRAMLDRAVALGAKTVVEPTEIPGIGWFALFADPDGNTIGLLRQQPA
ncbi:VOC family protein [Kribbella speibonae]|uniref:VOC family protein n=1 Tax=Kribbella speibonae TaxID=1572660 RepID=A0A4R0IC64_9ACTN|nr:VOC family protein [Kribbella speibonae]TCC30723.1 VOC family protein [Kribbella speibonae]